MPEGDDRPALEPCRYCGTETRQRAEGIPYCSSSCIGRRRQEHRRESFRCPYPDCDWTVEWLPDNGLSKAVARVDIREHRREHADA